MAPFQEQYGEKGGQVKEPVLFPEKEMAEASRKRKIRGKKNTTVRCEKGGHDHEED